MTKEEILAEPAGRRLDALVAYHLFGWKWFEDKFNNLRTFQPPIDNEWDRIPWGPGCFKEIPEEWPENRVGDWDCCGINKKTKRYGLPHYSTDDGGAWLVVKSMSQWMFDIKWGFFENMCVGNWQPVHMNASAAGFLVTFGDCSVLAESMPLAVCRAALTAKLKNCSIQ